MKTILISIKPKYVADILNGKKTIEIRKTMPKCDLPATVYIYCTKEEELFYSRDTQKWFVAKNRSNVVRLSNGVVKAKFTLNKVEMITCDSIYKLFKLNDVLQNSCLTEKELFDYLKGEICYAWHISNLVIFDKPKELSEFEKVGSYNNPTIKCKKKEQGRCNYGYGVHGYIGCEKARLTKAPQSWCYVEVEE